jgi:hypothetical protein
VATVPFLLQFNGTVGSQNFANDNPTGITFSAYDPSTVIEAGGVFGNWLAIGATSGGGIFGSGIVSAPGDFEIELFMLTPNVGFNGYLWSIGDPQTSTGFGAAIGSAGELVFQWNNINTFTSATGVIPSGGTPIYVSIRREAGTILAFVGPAGGTAVNVGGVSTAVAYSGIPAVGTAWTSGGPIWSPYTGHFDMARLTTGSVRHSGSGSFLVPTAQFVYDGDTPPVARPFAQQTASVGGTATFAPSYNDAPTSYQWYKDGVPISGATSSSYTTPAATAADNGALFSVVAANGFGAGAAVSARLFVRDIKSGYGRKIGSAWQFKSSNRSARGTIQFRKQTIPGIDASGGAARLIWNDWWWGLTTPDTPVNPDADFVVFTGYAPTLVQTANRELIPGPDTVAFTGYSPTIAQPVRVDPLTGAVTFTGYVPTVAQSALVSLTPGVGAITITKYAPTVDRTANVALIPGTKAIAFTGYAPTIAQPSGVAPSVGAIGLTGYAPTLVQGVTIDVLPGTGAIAFTTKAPGVARTAHQTVAPDSAALTFAGYVPAVDTTSTVTLVPGTAAISLLGNTPSITQGAGVLVQPGTGTFALATYAPSVSATDYHFANPGQGSIVFTGYAPVIVQDNKLSPAAGTVALAGYAPSIAQPKGLTPGVGSVAFVGYAPTVGLAVNVYPGNSTLAFTSYAPTVDQSVAAGINPGVGQITFTGYAPSIAQPREVVSGTGSIVLSGYAPSIAQPWAGAPGTKAITFTGYAPALAQTVNQSVNPGTGALAFTGLAPAVAQSVNQALVPGTGTLTFTGYTPQVAQSTGAELVPDTGNITFTGYPPTVTRQANVSLVPATGNIVLTGYAPSVTRAPPQGPGASGMRRWLIQYYTDYFAKRDKEKALEEVSKELVKQASAGVIPMMQATTPVVTFATEQLATEAKQRREAVKKRHLDSEVKKMMQELSEEINPYSSFKEPEIEPEAAPIKDDDDDEDMLLAIAMLM